MAKNKKCFSIEEFNKINSNIPFIKQILYIIYTDINIDGKELSKKIGINSLTLNRIMKKICDASIVKCTNLEGHSYYCLTNLGEEYYKWLKDLT